MYIVHQSTIKCWRKCRRLYHYRYVERIEKRKPPAPLMRGTVVHEMIEAHANGTDVWAPVEAFKKRYAKLFAEEREHYGDLVGEIERLMSGYFEWYKKDPLVPFSLVKGGPKAEHKFSVNLTPSIILEGKVDLAAHDRMKRKWLTDHKTHKQLPQGDIKYSDIQSALYCWALECEYPKLKFDGVAWNYIRWKAPVIPDLLKDGSMSRRKNIDTTWAVYRQAVKDAGLDPKDYADMKQELDGKEGDFYVRSYLPVNRTITENLLEEARVTAREMKRKGGRDKTRTIEKHCSWCEFYNLCQAELRGLDADFIRKHDYKEKVDEEQVSTVDSEE